MKDNYIGIDIGKTKLAIGVISESGNILSKVEIDTPKNADELIGSIIEQINQIVNRESIKGIGIATFGAVDQKNGIAIGSDVIKGWRNIQLAKIVEEKYKIKTYIENDANAAAIGEFYQDSKGINVYISTGTSIGMATIIDGVLIRGENNLAGEIARYRDLYSELMIKDYTGGKRISERISDKKGYHVTTKEFFYLVKQDDIIAKQMYNDMIKSMINLIKWINIILNPKKIVLGGGIISRQSQLFEDINRVYMESISNESPSIGKAKLEKAKYGENSGIIGATKLCITKLKGKK